jgi:hypothetical protein
MPEPGLALVGMIGLAGGEDLATAALYISVMSRTGLRLGSARGGSGLLPLLMASVYILVTLPRSPHVGLGVLRSSDGDVSALSDLRASPFEKAEGGGLGRAGGANVGDGAGFGAGVGEGGARETGRGGSTTLVTSGTGFGTSAGFGTCAGAGVGTGAGFGT